MIFGLSGFEIIIILAIVLLIFLLPTLLRMRLISGVNKNVFELEKMVDDSKKIIIDLSKERGKPVVDPTDTIDNFMEFFVVPPVDLDPNGVVKKFEKLLDLSEDRFKQMIKSIAPLADENTKSNLTMTLKATLGINDVARQIRHNMELAKKTGNFQILLILQMSLPLIMRIVRAQFEGVKSFSKGKPIGDGLGPLVAGMLMRDYKTEFMNEKGDMIIVKKVYDHHNVFIVRPKGPGARIGKVGRVVSSLIEKEGIDKLITVDAAVKLEGEETGKVAQGIGVVIGGTGVDKWSIEEEILKRDIDVDALIVKMSPEEAISNMNQKIADAALEALGILKGTILNSKNDTNILVVGVGNSCGIPNIIEDISQIEVNEEEIEEKRS